MQNSKLKFRIQNYRKGFTLIELLVVMVVLLVIGSILISILISSLRGTNKVNSIDNVRRNGNYALEQMGKMIRYSRSFNGVSTDGVTYTTSCVPPIAAVLAPPVVSVPPPSLGFFSKLASLIKGFGNLGKKEVSSLFSKLASIPQSFISKGTPRREVAAAANAVSTGPTYAAESTLGTGTITVTNPQYTKFNDALHYATTTVGASQRSKGILATGFGFTIPLDAKITGIVVEARYYTNVSTATTGMGAQLTKNGTTLVGTSTGEAYSNHSVTNYYDLHSGGGGGTTNLWGTTWTPAEINSSTFGIGFADQVVSATGASTNFSIYHFRITVYYDIPSPVPSSTPTPTPTPGPTSTPAPPTPTPTPALYHYIKITGFDGGKTIFSCLDGASGEIASYSGTLDSIPVNLLDTSTVNIDSCTITCTQGTVVSPQTVTIQFSLSNKNSSELLENKAAIPFQTSVTVRNY